MTRPRSRVTPLSSRNQIDSASSPIINRNMLILGINAFHPDAAAAIYADGQLIAAAEEERFNRIKHWAGFPVESIRYCLQAANAEIKEVDHVAVSRNPRARFFDKVLFALRNRPRISLIRDRLRNAARMGDLRALLAEALSVDPAGMKQAQHHIEHHDAHMASAFFVSPFDEAACLSIDGFGDFLSAKWGIGRGTAIEPLGAVAFPHSLGILYTAVTQYLGFASFGDEYKVMGLAPYGEPEFAETLRAVIRPSAHGFELDLSCFQHHSEGVSMTWNNCAPVLGAVYSNELVRRLGPSRKPGTPLECRHRNIAASLQCVTEEIYLTLLRRLQAATRVKSVCIAGGVAFNSVANGKILQETGFDRVYIQPAAGDAGTAIGAAAAVRHTALGFRREFMMSHSYWGPEYSAFSINSALDRARGKLDAVNTSRQGVDDDDAVCAYAAEAIASGLVVGWFQGRMEWGPRALGNRSILADPRNREMKDILNTRIKNRESFRPFCPSVIAERMDDYFESSYPEPFMIKVYTVRPEQREVIPAVTHVDGTARVQTVRREDNPLYYKLLERFHRLTGVPVLLNTSFNENEPIVRSPEEAIDCFARTALDVLIIGRNILAKPAAASFHAVNKAVTAALTATQPAGSR